MMGVGGAQGLCVSHSFSMMGVGGAQGLCVSHSFNMMGLGGAQGLCVSHSFHNTLQEDEGGNQHDKGDQGLEAVLMSRNRKLEAEVIRDKRSVNVVDLIPT